MVGLIVNVDGRVGMAVETTRMCSAPADTSVTQARRVLKTNCQSREYLDPEMVIGYTAYVLDEFIWVGFRRWDIRLSHCCRQRLRQWSCHNADHSIAVEILIETRL